MNRPCTTARPGRAGAWLVLAAATAAAAGCVPYASAPAPDGARFAALHARRLGALQLRLDAERQARTADAWTEVGEAWVALASCRPVPALVRKDDAMAAFVHAALVVEGLRRDRAREADEDAALLPERLRAPGYFDRTRPPAPPGWIAWPAETERWVDELPGPRPVDAACGRDPGQGWSSDRNRLAAERAAVERALEAGGGLPETDRAGAVARLLWRLRVHGARLTARLEANPEAVLDWLEPLADAPGLSPEERAPARLLRAAWRLEAGRAEAARDDLDAALTLGLDGENLWLARALAVRAAVTLGHAEAAVRAHPTLPPEGSRHRALHAWWLGRAHRLLGRDDRFLALASDALRATGPQDPVGADLYRRALDVLAQVPFEPRVVALVEGLGPPATVHLRLHDLGEAALERGRPDTARAVADWLLAHHRNGRHRHRYLALAALAEFQQDRPEAFRRRVRAIVRRDPGVADALGPTRLAAFQADADEAMATVLRRVVPRVAEWPERDRRRVRWLALVVDEAARFLDRVDGSAARRDVAELRRLAAAMLPGKAPGYAARVGRDVKRPLVLGRVRVPADPTPPPGGATAVEVPPARSLVLIPLDGRPPSEWPTDFDEETPR